LIIDRSFAEGVWWIRSTRLAVVRQKKLVLELKRAVYRPFFENYNTYISKHNNTQFMATLTRERLTALTETKLGRAVFAQWINEAKNENKNYATTTVFLSHSHEDFTNGDLSKVIVALRSVGVRVYIDSQDASMPPFTNAETAHRIKQAIKTIKNLFYWLRTELSILNGAIGSLAMAMPINMINILRFFLWRIRQQHGKGVST
jgi:hypothetical protein